MVMSMETTFNCLPSDVLSHIAANFILVSDKILSREVCVGLWKVSRFMDIKIMLLNEKIDSTKKHQLQIKVSGGRSSICVNQDCEHKAKFNQALRWLNILESNNVEVMRKELERVRVVAEAAVGQKTAKWEILLWESVIEDYPRENKLAKLSVEGEVEMGQQNMYCLMGMTDFKYYKCGTIQRNIPYCENCMYDHCNFEF